jgi:lipid A 3-O-deacylase
MKHFLLSIFMLYLATENNLAHAQPGKDTSTMLLRIYEDNDFINIYMHGTDNAYTNGSRIDLFYVKKEKPRFLIDRLMPKAGNNSSNIYGWGITQLMYTPNNIATTQYQPDDYPYSGVLFATHSLYSYDNVKKYDMQTELALGVSGPASLTKQAQTLVHHMIHYQVPMGWRYQKNNTLMLNLNFTAEKQLANYNGWIEWIGGSQVYAGTTYNAVSLFSELRIGKMSPYFKGLISQYSKASHLKIKNTIQLYVFAKPQPFLVFSDQLLTGRVPETNSDNTKNTDTYNEEIKPYHEINRLVNYFSYGAVLTTGDFAISFTQTSNSAQLNRLYNHEFGNISLYFSL